MSSGVASNNPAPTLAPTLAAPESAPPQSDRGSAKATHVRNTTTAADIDSPATSDISPAPIYILAPPPVGEAQTWTKDICEICWLPVQGKRPSKLKRQKKKSQQQQDQKPKKKWWSRKKNRPQEPDDSPEEEELEYWIRLPCEHRFGSSCLKEWRKTEDEAAENRPASIGQAQNQCPTCKEAYLYHTCHRKARWKVVRGFQAAKRFVTLAPPEICVRCELDAIDDRDQPWRNRKPYWDYGFATLFVGLVMWAAVPHNQKHGYEPVTQKRQFVLRHLPKRWRGAMERTWHTRITIGTEENPKAVKVQYTRLRRCRKMTRAERKVWKKQRRAKRKMARNLIRKKNPGRQNDENKVPAVDAAQDAPMIRNDAATSTASTTSTTAATPVATSIRTTAPERLSQTRERGTRDQSDSE